MPFWTMRGTRSRSTALALIGICSPRRWWPSALRLRFPGRDLLFILLLTTIMLPTQVTLIPTFLIFRSLGWWIPFTRCMCLIGSVVVFLFFLLARQFITTIPYDLDDAAKIDGCSIFGIYWRIILPLIKPALATSPSSSFCGVGTIYITL